MSLRSVELGEQLKQEGSSTDYRHAHTANAWKADSSRWLWIPVQTATAQMSQNLYSWSPSSPEKIERSCSNRFSATFTDTTSPRAAEIGYAILAAKKMGDGVIDLKKDASSCQLEELTHRDVINKGLLLWTPQPIGTTTLTWLFCHEWPAQMSCLCEKTWYIRIE